MVSEKTKENYGAVGLSFFILGIFLMIISSGVDIIFGFGLLLILTSITMGLFALMWSIAGTASRAISRFNHGDYEQWIFFLKLFFGL